MKKVIKKVLIVVGVVLGCALVTLAVIAIIFSREQPSKTNETELTALKDRLESVEMNLAALKALIDGVETHLQTIKLPPIKVTCEMGKTKSSESGKVDTVQKKVVQQQQVETQVTVIPQQPLSPPLSPVRFEVKDKKVIVHFDWKHFGDGTFPPYLELRRDGNGWCYRGATEEDKMYDPDGDGVYTSSPLEIKGGERCNAFNPQGNTWGRFGPRDGPYIRDEGSSCCIGFKVEGDTVVPFPVK